MSILDELAAKARQRVVAAEQKHPLADVARSARLLAQTSPVPSFYQALQNASLAYICEVKRASPSKGMIAPDFPYRQIALDYQNAGATAISCLTEPFYFKGKNQYLQEIAQTVTIPVLRKDFIVDPYMIYEARRLGAAAILLIAGLLSVEQLTEYRQLAQSLGMDALVEVHNESELQRALKSGARIIGVNNRNLNDFTVDPHTSIQLRGLVPDNVLFVSESGIKNAAAIQELKDNRVNGVLIGETLMRSPDKARMLKKLNGGPLD